MNSNRMVAASLLRQEKCGLCGGAFSSEVMERGDSVPEIGIEECMMCGALWNMDEDSWMGDLRGGVGMVVRGPTVEQEGGAK